MGKYYQPGPDLRKEIYQCGQGGRTIGCGSLLTKPKDSGEGSIQVPDTVRMPQVLLGRDLPYKSMAC